jgi:hypothetical protein
MALRCTGPLFGVILVDPLWRFEPRSRITGRDRAAGRQPLPISRQDQGSADPTWPAFTVPTACSRWCLAGCGAPVRARVGSLPGWSPGQSKMWVRPDRVALLEPEAPGVAEGNGPLRVDAAFMMPMTLPCCRDRAMPQHDGLDERAANAGAKPFIERRRPGRIEYDPAPDRAAAG